MSSPKAVDKPKSCFILFLKLLSEGEGAYYYCGKLPKQRLRNLASCRCLA